MNTQASPTKKECEYSRSLPTCKNNKNTQTPSLSFTLGIAVIFSIFLVYLYILEIGSKLQLSMYVLSGFLCPSNVFYQYWIIGMCIDLTWLFFLINPTEFY